MSSRALRYGVGAIAMFEVPREAIEVAWLAWPDWNEEAVTGILVAALPALREAWVEQVAGRLTIDGFSLLNTPNAQQREFTASILRAALGKEDQ